jgi:hypothetical protein
VAAKAVLNLEPLKVQTVVVVVVEQTKQPLQVRQLLLAKETQAALVLRMATTPVAVAVVLAQLVERQQMQMLAVVVRESLTQSQVRQ